MTFSQGLEGYFLYPRFDQKMVQDQGKHKGSVVRLWFSQSFDRQIFSLVGYCKKTNAFLVYAICFHENVHDKSCLHKSVRQTENGLECSFVKHWLNSI